MTLFFLFTIIAIGFLYLFIRNREHNPLWLMLSAWSLGIGIPRLHWSPLESAWDTQFRILIGVSLVSFSFGFWLFTKIWQKYRWWEKIKNLKREVTSVKHIRYVIYFIFSLSLIALYLFYRKAGNFPLLAPDSDEFRFVADEKVAGLINYSAQLARLFIPLSFFVIFYENFSWRKHWDLFIFCLIGIATLTVFASRTQIFFIDLWIMALYLIMRKPNWKQALKFYPIFLIISVFVLSVVPMIRNYKSYGPGNYLAGVTGINTSALPIGGSAFVPIYVGVSFNMQSLLHATDYYQTHPLQYGKVTLDPFTNIFGKVVPFLNQYKSDFNLCNIFQCWWNTGTYLFPFVQDFGIAAFYLIPFFIAGIIALVWQYWQTTPNFLSINLYAYACFFIVMTIYLSFSVRAEMYLDLAFLFLVHLYVSKKT